MYDDTVHLYAQVVRLTHSILAVNTNFNWTIIINTLESLYSLEKKRKEKKKTKRFKAIYH